MPTIKIVGSFKRKRWWVPLSVTFFCETTYLPCLIFFNDSLTFTNRRYGCINGHLPTLLCKLCVFSVFTINQWISQPWVGQHCPEFISCGLYTELCVFSVLCFKQRICNHGLRNIALNVSCGPTIFPRGFV